MQAVSQTVSKHCTGLLLPHLQQVESLVSPVGFLNKQHILLTLTFTSQNPLELSQDEVRALTVCVSNHKFRQTKYIILF